MSLIMNGHFIHGKIKLKRCMSFINKKKLDFVQFGVDFM